MNKSHVESLHYLVKPGKNVDYEKAEPVTMETEAFSLSVNPKEAVFTMKKHYATEKEAKAVVDYFLRTWEVVIGLDENPGDLQFIYKYANIIDLSPINTHLPGLCGGIHAQTADNLDLHESKDKLPSLPKGFFLSPDVETMFFRYKVFCEGRESLLGMAYFCLTVVENSAGNRKAAAKKYAIGLPVLSKLGTLCSERGSIEEARKNPKKGTFLPLSSTEKEWVVKVVKALIRRVGEYENDQKASLRQLTMDDFPSI